MGGVGSIDLVLKVSNNCMERKVGMLVFMGRMFIVELFLFYVFYGCVLELLKW